MAYFVLQVCLKSVAIGESSDPKTLTQVFAK